MTVTLPGSSRLGDLPRVIYITRCRASLCDIEMRLDKFSRASHSYLIHFQNDSELSQCLWPNSRFAALQCGKAPFARDRHSNAEPGCRPHPHPVRQWNVHSKSMDCWITRRTRFIAQPSKKRLWSAAPRSVLPSPHAKNLFLQRTLPLESNSPKYDPPFRFGPWNGLA